MSTTKKPNSKKFKKNTPTLDKEKDSPSISRKIPEPNQIKSFIANKYFIVSILLIPLITALFMQLLALQRTTNTLSQLEGRRSHLQKEVTYWEKITFDHPNYRDAYFKLTLLEYQLGDTKKAKFYLDKTLEIDPNYLPALNFSQQL